MHELEVFTVGHGVRPTSELISALREAGRETLADVRRFPFSRRNPQFNQAPLRAAPEAEGITYRHAVELGGLRSDEPGEAEFLCAETMWTRCHRRLISDLLVAKGHPVIHLLGPGRREPHRLYHGSEARGGYLYTCGQLVG